MGFRFRKSIKILPGLRLNISKKGVSSLSIGGRGATLNVGNNGVKATVGLPGTGISYSEQITSPQSKDVVSNENNEQPVQGRKTSYAVVFFVAATILFLFFYLQG